MTSADSISISAIVPADEWMDHETSGGICRKLTSLPVALDPVLEMDNMAERNSNISAFGF